MQLNDVQNLTQLPVLYHHIDETSICCTVLMWYVRNALDTDTWTLLICRLIAEVDVVHPALGVEFLCSWTLSSGPRTRQFSAPSIYARRDTLKASENLFLMERSAGAFTILWRHFKGKAFVSQAKSAVITSYKQGLSVGHGGLLLRGPLHFNWWPVFATSSGQRPRSTIHGKL